MSPKKGEIADISGQLEELKTIINSYKKCFNKLEKMMEKTTFENKELKKKHEELQKVLKEQDVELYGLRDKLNDYEVIGLATQMRRLSVQEEVDQR